MALQANRQIEMVIGCVGVRGLRLPEKRNAIVPLAAHRDPFVVHHLGQRQNPRHACKSLLGRRIIA